MRVLAGFILLLFLRISAFAEPGSFAAETDSTNAKTIDRLNDISFDIYLESPDSARVIAEKALILAEKIKYHKGIGESFLNIGHVYWSQSYYPVALFYVEKALTELPQDQKLLVSSAYNTLGRIYADLGNYQKAFIELDKSERLAYHNPVSLVGIYGERSLIYKRQKKYDMAITEANTALKLSKRVKDDDDAAVLYGRLSTIFTITGRYAESLAYSDTAVAMSLKTRNRRLRATTYVEYASIYNKLQNYDKAIAYAKKAGDLADSIGVVDAISGAYKELISSYESKGDLHTAMSYQKRYSKMQDSLARFNRSRNAQLIQDYFTLDKKISDMAAIEHNNAENKAMLQLQRRAIITLIVSLVVVLSMLWGTWLLYKQKKRLSDQLNQQNEDLVKQKQLIETQTADLETLSKVKDKLLAVIAHDLRTPMANLRNITDMFAADYLSQEEVHFLMRDINPMVKSAELTLSNVLEWAGSQIKGRNVNSSNLDIFELGTEMEQIFSQALQKKNIEFINQATQGQSVLADENHIKIVLRNLISNAIKFTDMNGRVQLNSEYQDDKIIVSVEDNGKGMSDDEIAKLFSIQTHFSQRGTSGEGGTGIGLLLCKELIELNGGKLWTNSTPGKGSTFYFSLPLKTEYA